VDYSRKYGVGYVLDDGSVGCLTTATEHHPVTVASSTDGLRHLKELSKDQDYANRIPIQFYAAPKKAKGMVRVQVTDQRRENDIRNYWQKFGRYMCMQLGDEDWPKKDAERSNFVKFYQRLGNVGIWGFDNGSFQVCTAIFSQQTLLTRFSSTSQITPNLCSHRMPDMANLYVFRWKVQLRWRKPATSHGCT
jgi:myosin-1